MTRFYLDCEFIEDGVTIDLISIGLVCEDGREYYAENSEARLELASDWVKKNVISCLYSQQSDKSIYNAWSRDGGSGGLLSRQEIARSVLEFCDIDRHGIPEFWGEWCAYDWVAFCQLFGKMIDLPKGYPMRCRDIIQMCKDELGLSSRDLPASLETDGNHNALLGARTVKLRHEWLIDRGTKI
jgi:3' exoribonuclease, RNase T-like